MYPRESSLGDQFSGDVRLCAFAGAFPRREGPKQLETRHDN